LPKNPFSWCQLTQSLPPLRRNNLRYKPRFQFFQATSAVEFKNALNALKMLFSIFVILRKSPKLKNNFQVENTPQTLRDLINNFEFFTLKNPKNYKNLVKIKKT
jgi:hypothetical protein